MQILTGLFPHMVLQRTSKNVSAARITGITAAAGPVLARVTKNRKPLPGFAARKIGVAKAGKISATLAGLPAGGPYTVELSIASEKLTVPNLLVGDVWIVAGQSNAQGYGLLATAAKPHPLTRAFYMNDQWAVAKDPIHNMWQCVDQVHRDLGAGTSPDTVAGTGPGVAFAHTMHQLTGVPQGLLACAHGGTSMQQWDPAKKDLGTKSLYGATLRRVAKNGGSVAGIIWYQGESDANANDAAVYVDRMKTLVASFRKDLKSPTLPFALVQIGRFVIQGEPTWWNAIQDLERRLPSLIKNVTTVPAIDLTLDDLIHISGTGQQVVGQRLARAVHTLRKGKNALPAPIELTSITWKRNPARGYGEAHITFDNVVGNLSTTGGRPSGFSLLNGAGANTVFATELLGSIAILRTTLAFADGERRVVHYGQGFDPCCNIIDSAGRPLPAFGPVSLFDGRALAAFPQSMEVSAFQPSAGKLEDLSYPQSAAALNFAPRPVTDRFAHVHPELAALAPQDVLVYFRFRLSCAEAMKLNLLFGYDGPVKLFVDGKEVFYDPNGTNPAIVDTHAIPFAATAGDHEILAALGSNQGRAWGVFLRAERTGLTAAQRRAQPPQFKMPTWVG